METKLINILSTLSALIGTWLLAFGLRIKEGIDPKFRKEFGPSFKDKNLIIPADVSQRKLLFWIGLLLISLGAFLQICITIIS